MTKETLARYGIPENILDAARLITEYFAEKDIKGWIVDGCAERNLAERNITRTFTQEEVKKAIWEGACALYEHEVRGCYVSPFGTTPKDHEKASVIVKAALETLGKVEE